jgi:hypothetical protein
MAFEKLRRGDLVEVRGPAEILATLDENACLDGLPFMPEMVQRCGQRLTVDKRADKLCDTTFHHTGSRHLPDAVFLSDQRCDGSGHGGCQAGCRMCWKEVWLRKVVPGDLPSAPPAQADLLALLELARRGVKRTVTVEQGTEERWRCQLTDLYEATQPVSVWNPCAYVGQYTNGNVGLGHCLRVTARAAVEEPLRRLGMTSDVMRGTATAPVSEKLDLQPGEWVQVRSKEEILATLTPNGTNRGLWFDREMAAYCGGKFRVKQRISRFIDDFRLHGRMVEMKSDAVTLDGANCSGDLSTRRWFCPREATPYWRECWLRRVDAPQGAD